MYWIIPKYKNLSNFFLKITLNSKSSDYHKQEQKQHFLLKKYVNTKNTAHYDLDIDIDLDLGLD